MLCSFEVPWTTIPPPARVRAGRSRTISGGFGVGETPLPIPNRAVKPHSADGTWPSRARESRSPPVLHQSRAVREGGSWSLTVSRARGEGRHVPRLPADERDADPSGPARTSRSSAPPDRAPALARRRSPAARRPPRTLNPKRAGRPVGGPQAVRG